ncbi:MAG TPA: TonB family protein [Rhodanobacteraceae bacterium]|nr:TonB family protein [Rhodanobacteraceae bacterium]
MTDNLLRMLLWATLGIALVLLLRKPARRLFGAGPAFALWLLPWVMAVAPLLPRAVAPAAIVALPVVWVRSAAPIGTAAGIHLDFGWLLVALWLAGAACGIARLGVHYLRLRKGARRGSAAWLRGLQAAAPGLDPRRVRMHAAGPAVLFAWPRSWLLLPEDFTERFDDAATRALVLRHELTHLRRGDACWSVAMELSFALLWFHPLSWFARSRFRLDMELACDAASLRAAPQRSAGYARALLDSVAAQPTPALIPWLAEPQLKERIAMISRIPPGRLRRRAGFISVASLLGAALFVASASIGAQVNSPAAAQPNASSPKAHPPRDASIAIRTPAPRSSATSAPSVDVSFKNQNPPRYPAAAVKANQQGRVMLDVTVDPSGKVVGVAVDVADTNAPTILQSAAIAAARRWKFNPGRRNGRAVGGVLRIPVNFSLGGPIGAKPGACPPGFQYRRGKGKSYSCIVQGAKS